MGFTKYFQEELIELRKLAAEAAEKNPALAAFLRTPGQEADIERLFEGFSFLGGMLRQKLDDDVPELTHGLFSLLWPNYLRPTPATSIVQYEPSGNLTGPAVVPKGTLMESVPIDGIRWRFKSVYETEILPLILEEQRLFERKGEIILAVRFTLTQGILNTLPLSRLRFFFAGEKSVSHSLYFTLLRQVREIRFVLRDKNKEEHVTAVLGPEVIKPLGFQEDEGLFPYPKSTPLGCRILQEYFCFPEKFLFVDVSGLEKGIHKDKTQNFPDRREFELQFVLKRLPEQFESFHTGNWKLFCTPVVNIFPMSSDPMVISQERFDYKIIPDQNLPEHFSVYSVDKVKSWGGGKKGVNYENANSFEHSFDEDEVPLLYQLYVKPNLTDEEAETFIKIDAGPRKRTIRFELTCTNRIVSEKPGIGDICVHAADNHSLAASFKNILPLTVAYPPPLEKDYLWKLFSNMSLNYIPLEDVTALRTIIATYNFKALRDRNAVRLLENQLQGIAAVNSVSTDRIFRGIPLRGMQTRITMDKSCFCGEGEMYLFGAVLNEFLAQYATVHSYHQLAVEAKTGETFLWPAVLGSTARR